MSRLRALADSTIYFLWRCCTGYLFNFDSLPLGSFGDLSTVSFHETKNISCGEGGCLIIHNQILLKELNYTRERYE